MFEHRIGDRVAVIESTTDTTINLYGWGMYQGYETPPGWEDPESDDPPVTVKIVSDNGSVFWGHEVNWMPVMDLLHNHPHKRIVHVRH